MTTDKFKGLKVGLVGFLITIAGFILYVLKLELIGRLIVYSGFILGFYGIGLHAYLFFKK